MAEHINNFSGGMHRDNNPIYQPDGTYRYARNFTPISHDGNNVTIRDSLGNRAIFTITAPFDTTIASKQTEPTAIGMLSFPDKVVVFSTNHFSIVSGTSYGEIGYLSYVPFGESMEQVTATIGGFTYGGYVPLYHHTGLAFDKQYAINNEGFCYEENELIKRAYWTDNFNEPRVIDIADPIFTTYYATGSLVVGEQYMVLGGAITHNAVNYGPGLTATNVFTAVNANWTTAADTPLVIKYYPYQLLNWTPARTLGGIHFQEYGSGSVNCGGKMYFYRLGLNSGYFTSWSYGCPPIHVGMANTVVTGNAYHDFVGNGGLNITPINSNKSVKVKIDNIDQNFDIIQLACCEYDSTFEVPTLISIVQQSSIDSTTLNADGSITLVHTGIVNLGTLTRDDVTLFPASILTCKTMCTNKNYNLIANLTERQEFSVFDKTLSTISAINYPLLTTSDPRLAVNDFIYGNIDPTVGVNPGANAVRPFSRWYVTFGDNGLNTVTYNGSPYYTGDVIIGVTGAYTITFTGTARARPCTYKRKYTPITSLNPLTSQRNDVIEFPTQANAFWNYKNPAVAGHNKGYWSHEKYRFGILFYDKKGNPFYVRHLGDFTMPDINTKSGLMRGDVFTPDGAGYQTWSMNPSGINIDGITLPPAIANNISGFSIVRAERDPRILMQGLMYQTTVETSGPLSIIHPLSAILLASDAWGNTSQGNYSYIIPDLNVASTGSFYIRGLTSLGAANTPLEQAAWLSPYDFSGGGVYLNTNSNYSVYAKFFANASDGLAKRTATIKYFSSIDEAGYITGFLPNQDFSNNTIRVAVVAGPIVNNTFGGFNNIDNRITTGGKKAFVAVNTDFSNFAGVNYYSTTDVAAGQKILMNYLRDNNSPYGGTGEVSLANTLYVSTGHFQEINATVLAETLSGGNYVFNGVHVFGGDCYTNMVDYGYGLFNNVDFGGTNSLGMYFPCENNANYDLRRGNKISNIGMFDNVVYPNGLKWKSTLGTVTILESYSYNEGYSSEGDLFKYPALPVNFVNAGRFPERIRFAGEKFIGEILDSFRTFLTNDYKDVNVVLGEINNIRPKGDYVYYWQNNGVGSAPITQRQLISGANGSETVLGTGGVVDSYQTISTVWGNQHKHGLTETKDGWIWFDMRNKSVCVMSYSGGVTEIDVPLGLKSWFNEVFLQVANSTYFSIALIDAPAFGIESDQPLLGVGICGVYDPKIQTSYLTFKFKNQTAENVIIAKDFTIGFNHQIEKFVGFYDMLPGIWHRHHQFVLSCNVPKDIQKFYGSGMSSTDFVKGDVIGDLNKEYVCTTAGTVASYVTPPDPAIFTQTSATNQIWVQNEESSYSTPNPGYQYNKQYGIVVNNELEFVVNPKVGQPFVVDNLFHAGNNAPITDLYADNTNQTGSDLSIATTNRNYQYQDGMWSNNLPISSTGRFYDQWLKIKFVKKNWATTPITLAGAVKIINFVKAMFRAIK